MLKESVSFRRDDPSVLVAARNWSDSSHLLQFGFVVGRIDFGVWPVFTRVLFLFLVEITFGETENEQKTVRSHEIILLRNPYVSGGIGKECTREGRFWSEIVSFFEEDYFSSGGTSRWLKLEFGLSHCYSVRTVL
jgi:hypothetical protein